LSVGGGAGTSQLATGTTSSPASLARVRGFAAMVVPRGSIRWWPSAAS